MLGEPWERAEHPHDGVIKGLGCGRGLTTFNHNSLSPHGVPCPQLLSESQTNMARLVSSVSDVLDTLQKERGGARPRLKADLQRAPARGARPRGCSNGETASLSVPGERDAPGAALGRSLPKKRGDNQPGEGI